MRKKLSTVALTSLAPGDYDDTVFPGLTFRVGARRKTWTFRHRAGGKQRRDRLGYFPELGLAGARAAARALAERADAGLPPVPAKPHPRSPDTLTLGKLFDQYEARRNAERHRVRRLPQAMHTLRRELADYLDMPAEKFSKADLRTARDMIVERGALFQANRMLAYLSPILRYAEAEDIIPVNFVRAVRRSPEAKRKRVLSPAELKAIWEACERLPQGRSIGAYGRLIKFLILTGQRISEAAGLKHGDLIDGCWRQPENKPDRELSLRLPLAALALIGSGEPHQLVFCGMTGMLSGFSKMKLKLDELSGVAGWRHHDLRRTMATRMEELDIRREVVQRILNHAIPGVAGVYLHSELERQKGDALQAWADEVARVVCGKTVAPLILVAALSQ